MKSESRNRTTKKSRPRHASGLQVRFDGRSVTPEAIGRIDRAIEKVLHFLPEDKQSLDRLLGVVLSIGLDTYQAKMRPAGSRRLFPREFLERETELVQTVRDYAPAVLVGLVDAAEGSTGRYRGRVYCTVTKNTFFSPESCDLPDFASLRAKTFDCPDCGMVHPLVKLEEAIERDLFSEGEFVTLPASELAEIRRHNGKLRAFSGAVLKAGLGAIPGVEELN